jgi:hypothetical protein
MGHIRTSSSSFASSMVLVKKKDGTMHMCIDYQDLNKTTSRIGISSLGLMNCWMNCMVQSTLQR